MHETYWYKDMRMHTAECLIMDGCKVGRPENANITAAVIDLKVLVVLVIQLLDSLSTTCHTVALNYSHRLYSI